MAGVRAGQSQGWALGLLSGTGAHPEGRAPPGACTPCRPHHSPPPPRQLALKNALRYFPPDVQEVLAPEFAQELRLYGHIYMYRFCPDLEMR